jgi:hypothetical protein
MRRQFRARAQERNKEVRTNYRTNVQKRVSASVAGVQNRIRSGASTGLMTVRQGEFSKPNSKHKVQKIKFCGFRLRAKRFAIRKIYFVVELGFAFIRVLFVCPFVLAFPCFPWFSLCSASWLAVVSLVPIGFFWQGKREPNPQQLESSAYQIKFERPDEPDTYIIV